MLLTRQKQESASPQLNMAAMVDVVFLLLIFFMCASSISQVENSLSSQVSHLGPGEGQESQDYLPIHIELQRVPNGVLVTLEEEPFADFDSLVARLREMRTSEEIPVIIKGQGAVPYGYMVAALDACYRAGFERVAFSAKGTDL
jgi:biopolymer transport protein ExbD